MSYNNGWKLYVLSNAYTLNANKLLIINTSLWITLNIVNVRVPRYFWKDIRHWIQVLFCNICILLFLLENSSNRFPLTALSKYLSNIDNLQSAHICISIKLRKTMLRWLFLNDGQHCNGNKKNKKHW